MEPTTATALMCIGTSFCFRAAGMDGTSMICAIIGGLIFMLNSKEPSTFKKTVTLLLSIIPAYLFAALIEKKTGFDAPIAAFIIAVLIVKTAQKGLDLIDKIELKDVLDRLFAIIGGRTK